MKWQLSSILASMDYFADPVMLNFRGRESFKTACGGMITIIVAAFASFLSYMTFEQMVMLQEPTI